MFTSIVRSDPCENPSLYVARKFYAEGCAYAEFRLFDEDATVVILLDDALGEGESKSPTAFLGGEAGLEYVVEILAGYALAAIGYIYIYVSSVACEFYGDEALATHGVNGIFAEVFDDPFHE